MIVDFRLPVLSVLLLSDNYSTSSVSSSAIIMSSLIHTCTMSSLIQTSSRFTTDFHNSSYSKSELTLSSILYSTFIMLPLYILPPLSLAYYSYYHVIIEIQYQNLKMVWVAYESVVRGIKNNQYKTGGTFQV